LISGSKIIILTNQKIHRKVLLLTLICVILIYNVSFSSEDIKEYIYKTGTKFVLTASWWGLSASADMEILGHTQFRGNDAILVRYQVTRMGGLMGFLVKFLRIYKESNTFDSYLDPDTLMAVRYEVYKLRKDNTKKPTEHVHFDRENKKIVSLYDDEIIIDSAAPEVQDAFALFLSLLYNINIEEPFVGQTFEVDLYAYRKANKIEVRVSDISVVNDRDVYILKIDELPDVFKHPTKVSFKVIDTGNGLKLPVSGECEIIVPFFPDITLKGTLEKVK